jgi:Na+/proline symporter
VKTDRIYPEFIWNNLPVGVAGLLIAAILAAAMANLSAALNSLASTTVVDFLRARGKQMTERQSMTIARWATVGWGLVLLTIAYGARSSESVLQAGLTIGSIPAGALLGVFLLGILTRRPGEVAAVAGAVAGVATVLAVHFYTPIAWTWYVMIGTVVTFGVGVIVGLFANVKGSQA